MMCDVPDDDLKKVQISLESGLREMSYNFFYKKGMKENDNGNVEGERGMLSAMIFACECAMIPEEEIEKIQSEGEERAKEMLRRYADRNRKSEGARR